MIKLGNTLKLEAELTESQMESIMKKAYSFLYDNRDCLNDTTFELYFPIRRNGKDVELYISAEFSSFLDQIKIKEDKQYFNELNAEIMDDYMVLKCDTMVFQQRLQFLLDDINKRNAAYTKEDEEEYRREVAMSYC